jgi:hypothetical protein
MICTVLVTEEFVVDIKKIVEVTFIGSDVVILVFPQEPQEILASVVLDLHFPVELSTASVFVVWPWHADINNTKSQKMVFISLPRLVGLFVKTK